MIGTKFSSLQHDGRSLAWLLAGFGILGCSAVLAQGAPGDAPSGSAAASEVPRQVEAAVPERLPEEVVITGRKLFRTMEREIREAEDRMYGLFNELNGDDYYDITCTWVKPPNSNVRQRQCAPAFVRDAQEDEALAYMGWGVTNPTMSVAGQHYPLLEEKLREVLVEHPEFVEAVIEHHELRQELEASKRNFWEQ